MPRRLRSTRSRTEWRVSGGEGRRRRAEPGDPGVWASSVAARPAARRRRGGDGRGTQRVARFALTAGLPPSRAPLLDGHVGVGARAPPDAASSRDARRGSWNGRAAWACGAGRGRLAGIGNGASSARVRIDTCLPNAGKSQAVVLRARAARARVGGGEHALHEREPALLVSGNGRRVRGGAQSSPSS